MARKKTDRAGKRRTRPSGTPQQCWQRALAAYERGDAEKARRALEPLLDLPSVPGEVELLAGLVDLQTGRAAAAEPRLQRAVRLAPARVEGWLGLGNAQQINGRVQEAIESLRQALRLQPDHPAAMQNLGVAYEDMGRYRDALDCFDRVLAAQPGAAGLRLDRARLLKRLGRADDARGAFEALLREQPDDALLQLELAELHEQTNRLDEAAAALPDEASLPDADARARAAEVTARLLARRGEDAAALESVRAARERTGCDQLGYREGILLDRMGRFEEALNAFRCANEARAGQRKFRRLHEQPFAEYVRYKVEQGIPAGSPDEGATGEPRPGRAEPVFLVGLPRSGTTLLDRMLGAHPEMQVLEELEALRVAEAAVAAGRSLAEARRAYWEYVERHVDLADGRIVLDKNPMHAPHLDLLPRLFPGARVVLALRHPFDAALSCYMQDFAPNPATVNFLDLESTARLCADMLSMMHLFEQACPERTVRVRYEDLVGDFRGEVTRVLRAIGLDWHPDVADYAARASATGMVTTPSYEQVTRPLYGSAIERWRNYEPWLEPFREHLGPMLSEFGYSAESRRD